MKQTAYKVVRVVDGRLMSLHYDLLGEYAIEYHKDKSTEPDTICFVVNTLQQARYFTVYDSSSDCQIWTCEGYFTKPDDALIAREVELDLWIVSFSSFMTEVRLLERIL